jgi:hypothetical protein
MNVPKNVMARSKNSFYDYEIPDDFTRKSESEKKSIFEILISKKNQNQNSSGTAHLKKLSVE